AHLQSCATCGPALLRLQRSRSLLARAPRFAAPARSRASVRELARSDPRSDIERVPRDHGSAARIRYLVGGAGFGALAASLLSFFLIGGSSSYGAQKVIDHHPRPR